jgi:peptidoglycan/xylan/chitin deacetylase (PgdA/CDA1 family)
LQPIRPSRVERHDIEARMKTFVIALVTLGTLSSVAQARDCDTDALGTSRTLTVKTAERAGIGQGYPALGVTHGEVILTFDDGPRPTTTPAILDALAKECVQATFFMVGKHAEAHPEIAARIRQDGHSVASHGYTHRELNRLAPEDATHDIERGYEAVEKAAFGSTADRPRLFRFPGWKSTPELIAFVASHHGIMVDRNINAGDWRGLPAQVTFERLKQRLDRQDRGIIALHDNQPETVKLVPMLLAELKARKMRVVHLVAE